MHDLYRGEEVHNYLQCLPVLTHKPEKLADHEHKKFPGNIEARGRRKEDWVRWCSR